MLKRKEWLMSMMVIIVLLFGLVLPVAAQDGGMPPVNCNGLSEEDCAIVTQAALAVQSGELQSFTMPAWSLNLDLAVGEEAVTFYTAGSGRAVLPPSAMALLSDMPEVMGADGYNVDALIAFYERLDADMIVQMLEELGLQLVIDEARLSAPGEAMSGSAEVLFKDMGLYVRLESVTGNEQWFGDELEITEVMKAELDLALAEMVAELQNPEFADALNELEDVAGIFMPLADVVNTHVMTTRNADAEMGGQAMYSFTTTFDLNGFLNDPDLPAAIVAVFENPTLAELSEEEMDLEINETQIQFVLMTASLLLGETSLSSTQWIGADDGLPHKLTLDLVVDVDLSLLGDPEVTGLTGNVAFMVEMDELNSATMDPVEVPAEYESLERTGEFLVGGPELIESELTLGQSYSGSLMGDDSEDVFSLELGASDTVTLEVASDDDAYVTVYGPDGFEVAYFDTYFDEEMMVTADAAGMYVIVIESYWGLDYDLTVRAE